MRSVIFKIGSIILVCSVMFLAFGYNNDIKTDTYCKNRTYQIE